MKPLKLLIAGLLIAGTTANPARAVAPIPDECRDHENTAQNLAKGWAFVMNFGAGLKVGCLITANGYGGVDLQPVACESQGDVQRVSASQYLPAGAYLGPGATVACYVDVKSAEAIKYVASQKGYWISANVAFDTPGERPILQFADMVGMSSKFSAPGLLIASSQYAGNGFEYATWLVANRSIRMRATVENSVGTFAFAHGAGQTQGKLIDPADTPGYVPVQGFPSSGQIVFGSSASTSGMLISEAVFDPAGRCCD